jgi:hypothetical protein
LDETKAKPAIFPEGSRSPKMRRRGARGQAHPRVARPAPGPRHQGWDQLVHLLTLPFRLYIPLDGKNLKDKLLFLKTYRKPPPLSTRDWKNPGALLGTLPKRGIPAGGLLHHHGRLWSDMLVVYLGLRVHSSSLMVVSSTMCFMFRSCELPYMIKIIFV